MRHAILLAFGTFFLLACNSYRSKLPRQGDPNLTPAALDYQFVKDRIFDPHCVQCHSLAGGNKGAINLEAYEEVVRHLEGVKTSVFIDESMPPKKSGGPLAENEKNILRLWIEAGTPYSRSAPSTPQPPPPSTPEPKSVLATWDSIYEHILYPKCIGCHSEGEKAEDSPLTDRNYVTDPANLLIVPGRPEDSELYFSITRQDKRVMPPPKTGIRLRPDEIEAIRLWIANGAKD